MKPDKAKILAAARADAIPEGESGLWYVVKVEVPRALEAPKQGRMVTIPAGRYTELFRWTDSTLHLVGELVMTDKPDELCTHLDFMLRAWGRVLVTGLGLGCCVRGLLANPNVEHVTVIENSPDVLRLVAPHMPKDRVTIIEAEAVAWTKAHGHGGGFDCAWHDLWTDTDAGERHLQVVHAELFLETLPFMRLVGAWAMPRRMRRLLNDLAWRDGKYVA